MRNGAAMFGLLAMLALPANTAAMDPPGYAAPFADSLETRNFPLLALLRTAPGWGPALRGDRALAILQADRASRAAATPVCSPRPACLADAWAWTPQDIAAVDTALRRVAVPPGRMQALVTAHLRPSGRFARHTALPDADMLAAAWADTAAGMNNLIAVYAKGMAPRYPLIDAGIFAVGDPRFAALLGAHGAVTQATARDDDLFFDGSLRYATGLLHINERTDAAAYQPLLAGENTAAIAAVATTRWADYRYPAILVFGHGPEDAQSRTGALGHIRMAMAASLFARGLAPFIIVSGGSVHPNRTTFNEAIEMKRLLVSQHDIPPGRILIEPHARHTTTNLRNTARLLFAAGFPTHRPALIVTDPMTARYIGGPELLLRARRETGITPGRITPAALPFGFEFRPDRAAFHVDPTDPLDP